MATDPMIENTQKKGGHTRTNHLNAQPPQSTCTVVVRRNYCVLFCAGCPPYLTRRACVRRRVGGIVLVSLLVVHSHSLRNDVLCSVVSNGLHSTLSPHSLLFIFFARQKKEEREEISKIVVRGWRYPIKFVCISWSNPSFFCFNPPPVTELLCSRLARLARPPVRFGGEAGRMGKRLARKLGNRPS